MGQTRGTTSSVSASVSGTRTAESPPPGPQQGEALVMQTAGHHAVLHGHAGGYHSHVLADCKWTIWHRTTGQEAFLPHVD